MLLRLAWQSLMNRRATVVLTMVSIACSVMLLLGVERVRQESRQSFLSTVSGTDLVVGARSGGPQLLLQAVFNVGFPTQNISRESYAMIGEDPRVNWIIPLSMGDMHRGYRVVGTTSAFRDHYRFARDRGLELAAGTWFSGNAEAVIGADVARELGYSLGQPIVVSHGAGDISFVEHDEHPFTVTGILAPSGTPVDRVVLVSLEGIDAMHSDFFGATEHDHDIADPLAAVMAGVGELEEHDDHGHEGHDHAEHDHSDHEDHSGHDHGDHEGHDHHDHSDHDHSAHDHHDHGDHEGHDHGDHSGHDHGDHSGHDHSDHSDHDHAGHDHDAHDHASHEGHDHGDHAHDDHSGHDHDEHDHHDHSDHAGHDHGDHEGHDHSAHDHGDHDHAHDDHAGHDHEAHDHDDHAGHDHGDHSGHDHDTHDHSDHEGHDHRDHDHAHDDHSEHDHTDHSSHDHGDHADHSGHDHGDHAGHDHGHHGHDHHGHDHDHSSGSLSALLVGLNDRAAALSLQRTINTYDGEALTAVLPGVALQELWTVLGVVERVLILLGIFVVVVGLLGMLSNLLGTLDQRRREMAILRSVGARPRHLMLLLVGESFWVSVMGALLGLGFLSIAMVIGTPMLEAYYGLHFALTWPTTNEWGLLGLIVLAGTLIGLIPGWRASRQSLVDGLTPRL